MKPLLPVLFLAAAVTAAPAAAQAPDRAAIDRAIAAVYPSLVRIVVVSVDSAGGREVKHETAGSGTIITPDGYVVTNHHVAGRARRIFCTLSDRQEVPADLVGTDPLADISVLKLHPEKPRTFPAAKFGISAKLQHGDPILAMGSPLALSQSVTLGIISNTEMIMPQVFGPNGMTLDGEDVATIVRWIGHDAAIYPGNSGGPLVSLTGEIVGVNEISYGLSGAIPVDLVKPVVDAIIKDGKVRRSWTGIEVQPMLGLSKGMAAEGGLIAWVVPKSPAAGAGLRSGDVLVKVNATPVDVKFAEQLPPTNQLLLGLPIGKPATVVVRRDGKDMTVTLTPIERPSGFVLPSELKDLGLVVSNVTAADARDRGRDSTDGVRILSVRAGSAAEQARPPLQRDDIIVEVNGKTVKTLADLETIAAGLMKSGPRPSALIGYDRGRERRLTVLENIGVEEQNDSGLEATKAWIPVDVQSLTPPLAERLGLKGKTGVRVTRLVDDSVKLQMGDVILAIDGDAVRATSPTDDELFAAMVRRYKIGSTVTLKVNRAGQDIDVPVTLGTAPRLPREMNKYEDPNFEFRARDIASSDREDPRLRDAPAGVFVETVSDGGWAQLGHLGHGDIILAVDGQRIATVADLSTALKALATRKPGSVVFEVRRGVKTMFVEILPVWKTL